MSARVSIVIPVFNHERFIRESIESVLAQDFPALEVVVVDDGSTDGTPAIVAEYRDRVRIIRQENAGAARALNCGLRAATGEWIGWLSSDDVFLPGKITAQLATARIRPQVGLLYSSWIKIDAAGAELSRHVSPELIASQAIWQLMQGNFINGSSVLLRRDVIQRHGVFDESLRADVDAEMWFRLLLAGVEFAHPSGFFLRYRWHAQNMSHQRLLMRQSMETTRMKVIRTATNDQLFPALPTGGSVAAARGLVRGLLRHECFGAAALAIKRGVDAGFLPRRTRGWIWPLQCMSSARAEPLVSVGRMARQMAAKLGGTSSFVNA
jgi:teichuronic acid biosynthesis glycosyltransferase TuaG